MYSSKPALPATSKVYVGLEVPIPKLPPLIQELPAESKRTCSKLEVSKAYKENNPLSRSAPRPLGIMRLRVLSDDLVKKFVVSPSTIKVPVTVPPAFGNAASAVAPCAAVA